MVIIYRLWCIFGYFLEIFGYKFGVDLGRRSSELCRVFQFPVSFYDGFRWPFFLLLLWKCDLFIDLNNKRSGMISYVWLWKCSKVRARWTMASDSCSDGWPITCWSVGGCSSIPDDSFIFNSGMRSGSAIDVLTSGPVADCCDNPLFWPGFPHHLTGFFWLDAPSYRRHNSLPSAFCLFYDFGSTILQHLGMFSSIINDFVALDRLWYPFRPSFIIEGFLRDFWGGFLRDFFPLNRLKNWDLLFCRNSGRS